MSHTYALLELSPAAYEEIKQKLIDAGYQSAINKDGIIDMHGIAIEPPRTPPISEREQALVNEARVAATLLSLALSGELTSREHIADVCKRLNEVIASYPRKS